LTLLSEIKRPFDANREYRRAEDELKKLLHRTYSEYFAYLLLNANPTRNIKCQLPFAVPDQRTEFWWPWLRNWKGAFNHSIWSADVDKTLAFLNAPFSAIEHIHHVSPEDVCLQIRELQRSKAPGFGGLGSRTARALPRKGTPFLVLLLNSMLGIHHFPT